MEQWGFGMVVRFGANGQINTINNPQLDDERLLGLVLESRMVYTTDELEVFQCLKYPAFIFRKKSVFLAALKHNLNSSSEKKSAY